MNFEPNAILRGAQLTLVGGMSTLNLHQDPADLDAQ
jgi:hypothetical protein